jgi:hypothetical protein
MDGRVSVFWIVFLHLLVLVWLFLLRLLVLVWLYFNSALIHSRNGSTHANLLPLQGRQSMADYLLPLSNWRVKNDVCTC